MEANKIDRLRNIIDNIRQLNDLWFDTFPTDDGQTSIHDDLEYELISANKILDTPPRISEEYAKPELCKSCAHYLTDGCEICGCTDYKELEGENNGIK